MSPRLVACTLALGAAVLLTACAPPATTGATSQEESTAATAAPAAGSPTPTPSPSAALVVGAEALTYEHDGQSERFVYQDDGEALLALVEDLTGEPREGVDIEDPWGNGDVVGAKYEWDEIVVSVLGERTSVSVSAAAVGGVPLATEEGVAVGATRDAVADAGGFDVYDEDGDGVADEMAIGAVEVPGTESLANPGEVGVVYAMVRLENDTVFEIQSPGNDFSDV